MKLRFTLILCLVALVAACAGDTGEPEAEPAAAPAEAAPTADEAALEALAAEYVTHYNLHHPSMVADYHTEDGIVLSADGSVLMGKEAILANLEAAMDASPTLSVFPAAWIVVGDNAVGRGAYGLELAPEGEDPVSFDGNWMAAYERVDDTWKLDGLITNYNAPPPAGLPAGTPPGEAPPEATDSPVAELLSYYATHFNMGHASMVADVYDEDAVSGSSNQPLAEGRAAIEAALVERMAEGSPQLTIHEVGFADLGEGWVIDGGWYEITATTEDGEVRQTGAYMLLCRQADDGSFKLHWVVSNGQPNPM